MMLQFDWILFNHSLLVRTIKLLMGVLSNKLFVHVSCRAVVSLLSTIFFEGIQLLYWRQSI
jgi:hypothetical protein